MVNAADRSVRGSHSAKRKSAVTGALRSAARATVAAMMMLVLAGSPAHADTPKTTAVFLESTPYGASVSMNGVPLPGTTPLLVTGLTPGEYRFAFARDGYEPRSLEAVIDGTNTTVVDITLSPQVITVVTPHGHNAFHPAVPDGFTGPLLLPPGRYRMAQSQATLRIEPIYPRQAMIDGLQFAVPLFMLVAASLAVSESINPRDTRLPVSVETLTATGVAIGLLATDIALHADRRAFRRSSISVAEPRVDSPASEQTLWEFALNAESSGDLSLAAAVHEQLVRTHPHSRRAPSSLYRAARIYLTQGEHVAAEALFLSLLADYPTRDTYDLARRNLADLYEITERCVEAIEQIDRMVFTDPSVPRDLMVSRRRTLESACPFTAP